MILAAIVCCSVARRCAGVGRKTSSVVDVEIARQGESEHVAMVVEMSLINVNVYLPCLTAHQDASLEQGAWTTSCIISMPLAYSGTSQRFIMNSRKATNRSRTTNFLRKRSNMTSLKRTAPSHGASTNLSSKVYVRTTRNGKVQIIVREAYLRQDIPCSSKLCRACLSDAPTNYHSRRACFH
jgi:hypothetical protein